MGHEFSVLMLHGIIIVICSDVGDAGKLTVSRQTGEKAAAQFLKTVRNIFCQQGGSYMLVKKRFRTDHLQRAFVVVNVSKPEAKQIIIDFIVFFL